MPSHHDRTQGQPNAPALSPRLAKGERAAIALSEQWERFIGNPTADSAAELQQQAAAANQDALELEALRFRLALLLPAGAVEPLLLEQLRALELRLRSPQSRGGHLGPPSSSR